jgi:hypothetical protein
MRPMWAEALQEDDRVNKNEISNNFVLAEANSLR